MQKSFVKTGDVNIKQRTVCNAKNMMFNKFILIAKPLHISLFLQKKRTYTFID